MLLGEKIKEVAKQKNMSLNELIERSGINRGTFYNVLKRDNMDTQHLEKFAHALEVPMSFFFEDKEPKNVDTKGIYIPKPEKELAASSYQESLTVIKEVFEERIEELKATIEMLKKDKDFLQRLIDNTQGLGKYKVQPFASFVVCRNNNSNSDTMAVA